MEALLLQKGDELSHRLAVRLANLIGEDGDRRRQIYDGVRDFYEVRSRLVHGDVLQERHKHLLESSGTLREYARLALLRVLGISRETNLDSSFFKMLDECSLDEEKRRLL